MKTEKSCGAVVFTRENGEARYVIIRSTEGFFGFPKGHMEPGETEQETALREIREETGLKVRLLDGFRTEDSHPFTRAGEQIMKQIIYFIGEYENQLPRAQESELISLHLMDYASAMNAFQFESSRRILSEAHKFLQESLFSLN